MHRFHALNCLALLGLPISLSLTGCGGGDSIENSLRHDTQGVFRQPASLTTASRVSFAEGFRSDDLAELANALEVATSQGESVSFTPSSRSLRLGKSFSTPQPRALTSEEFACQGGGTVRIQEDVSASSFSKIVEYTDCVTPSAQGDITLSGRTSESQSVSGTNTSTLSQSFELVGLRNGSTFIALNGSITTSGQEVTDGVLQQETRSDRLEMRFGNEYWARKQYLVSGEYQLDQDNNLLAGTETASFTVASTSLGGYVEVSTLETLAVDADGCFTQGALRYDGSNSHAELRFGDATGTSDYATLELSSGIAQPFADCDAVLSWMNRSN